MAQNYGYETLMTELPTYMKQVLRFSIKQVSILSFTPPKWGNFHPKWDSPVCAQRHLAGKIQRLTVVFVITKDNAPV
jgi:hypothetical protein